MCKSDFVPSEELAKDSMFIDWFIMKPPIFSICWSESTGRQGFTPAALFRFRFAGRTFNQQCGIFCKVFLLRLSNIVAMAEVFDDDYLVKQFNRGDDSAFDRIVEKYSGDVAALANRLLGWPGDVEDITQEIFVSAFVGLRKFRGDCSLKTWLFTITANKCRSHRYKRMLRQRRFSQGVEESSMPASRAADYRAMDNETSDRVRRVVKSLPTKCREAIVLRYLQELPTGEICRILGISANALQVRLNRARERLRQQLGGLIEE